MFELLGAIFQGLWRLVSIPITVEGLTFTTWQFFLYFIMLGIFIKLIAGKSNKGAGQ